MAESFAETLDRLQRQRLAAQTAASAPPTADLPTRYGQYGIPGGTLTDADTYAQGAEKFRVAGVDAPELMDKATHTQLLRPGQEAYQQAATLFQTPTQPERTGVDIHGRTVARPLTADGRDLGAEGVRQGLAVPKDWNRSGTLPYAREAAARFDDTHPPSEAAKARAEVLGTPLTGRTPILPEKDPKTRTYGEEAKAGLARGIDQAQSGLYGAVSMMGKLVADDSRGSDPLSWAPNDPRLTLRDKIANWLQRTGNTGAMRNEEQAARNPAAYSFDDVLKGKGDLLQWTLGVLGETAPSSAVMAATAAATGGVGALVGRAAGSGALGAALEQSAIKAAENSATTAIRRSLLERGIAPGLAQVAARNIAADPVKYATRAYAARAGFAGAWGGSAALEGGNAWTDAQKALGPKADPKYALAGGLAAGLLDTGAMAVIAAPFLKAFATPAAEAALGQVAGRTLGEKLASLVGATAKGGLRGIFAESPTETLQEVISVASVEAQKPSNVPLIDRIQRPEYLQRYIEAGAAGFVFGGAFGSVGGGFHHATRRTATPATPQDIIDATPADPQSPLGVGDAMPVGDQLQSGVDAPRGDPGADSSLEGADLAQAARNGVLADPQPPADFDNADAVGKQRGNAVDVNVDSGVEPGVLGRVQNDEVARRVIESIPVKVMDMLGFKERTPENFAHNKAVLLRSLAPSSDPSVRFFQLFVSQTLASDLKGGGASLGTAGVDRPGDLAGTAGEGSGTIGVGTDASRHSSTPLDQDTKGVGDAVPPASPVPPSIPLKRGESIVLRPGQAPAGPIGPVLNERGAPEPEVQERGPLPERMRSMRPSAKPPVVEAPPVTDAAEPAPSSGPIQLLNERGAPEPYQSRQPIQLKGRGDSVILRPGTRERTPSTADPLAAVKSVVDSAYKTAKAAGGSLQSDIAQEGLLSFPAFDAIADIGRDVPSHGMTKKFPTEAVRDLLSMRDTNTVPKHYAPLALRADEKGSGGGTTASGESTRDGPFILVGRRGGNFDNFSDVSAILVNPAVKDLVPHLRQLFPELQVDTFDNVGSLSFEGKPRLLAERERQGAAAPEELPPGVPPKRAGALARQAAEKAMAERTARATRITSLLDEIEKLEETNGDEAALPEQLAKSPNWMTSAPALAFIERHTEDLKPLFDAFHLASAADEDIGPFDETSTADVLRATWRHLNKDDFDREQEIRDYRDRRQQLEANGQLDLLAEREQQDVGAPEELPPGAPEELPPGAPEELPPGARPDLPETGNRYLAKDRGKWARATKFIGRGSPASSTEKYADALGGLANSGSYTAEDRVFISAEGARGGRIEPDFAEIQKALDAGATIITDGRSDRERGYNIGERQVASFLEGRGYVEEGDTGVWRPAVAPESATPSAPREPASAEASARAPRVESHSNGPAPSGPNTARARGPAPSAEPRSTPAPVASNASPSPSPPEVGSPSVPPGSAARKGFAFAKQLSTAWGNLLGIAPIEPALTEAQARSLADPTNARAHYDAALDVARSTAKQFISERWDSAGDKIKAQIQRAYAVHKSKIAFDSWLGEQVSQVLLHDDSVRRIYADAHLPAAYRWLRNVGQSLVKLINAFAKQFGYEIKEPNAAVAEWVRNAIDQQRTRFAEQQGISPETTRLLKRATNALLTDDNASTLLDEIEQRLAEEQTGSLYRNWFTALKTAQKATTTAQVADELATVRVREQLSAVLRDGLTKIDPWYALENFPSRKARRGFLRQRANDYLSGLPALEKASPEAADAARNVLRLAMQAEEALAVAGSFSRAVDFLPVRESKRSRGESMHDVASQSELVRGTDRAKAVLKGKQKAPEGYVPPAGAKAALSAYWQALGFAAEDAPPLLPATENLDDAVLGAHVAPHDDPVVHTRMALAEYIVASRALEGLPSAYRDSLVRAWRESGEGDFANFLINETDKVLASDAALYHVLYQATRDSADDAEQGKQLQIKRRTLNHLLGLALASKETPDPAVRDALRYRLRSRYGAEALADADRLLGGIGVRNPWFLLGQGYSKTADGSPAFDATRRHEVQRALRDAHRLLLSVPGLADEAAPEKAAFLRDNLPALAGVARDFEALAPGEDPAGTLVGWFDSLNKAMERADEVAPGESIDEAGIEETDSEEWEARAIADGANLADQELFQEIEDANERKTTLTNTIALVSQYDPAKGRLSPRLIRAFRSLPGAAEGGSLLNSDEATDFAHAAPLDTPFEADLDNKAFRDLPVALQHFLLQRGQLLGRMGVAAPEYRVKQHVARNGRRVSYLEESMTLSDRATLHGGRLKDGSPIAERLAIDHAQDMLDDAARRTSRFSAATKYGSTPGGNYAALKFDVKAAIDHPLIGAVVEAIERDPGVRERIAEIRASWAGGDRAALLSELDGLLPTVVAALDLDPTLKSLSDSGSLVPLLVAAMGYGQDVFYGGGNPSTRASLNAPDLRPHERASASRVEIRIDPTYAQELGLRAKPNAFGKPGEVYYSITFARDERAALSAFLRMYATNFDAASGTIKTGATREVNGDALVGLGMRSLNGLDAAPSVNFSRADSLYKGLDIASQLASPWIPADPFWQSWSGVASSRTATDPHLGLIVHYDAKRGPNEQWTLGDELSGRAAQQILQGDGVSSGKTPFSEKSLHELDLDVQEAAARLDELRAQYETSKGASLGEQALAEDGSPLWTYDGVLPENLLWRAMFGDNTAELRLYKARLAEWQRQQATKQSEKKLPKPEAPKLVEARPWLRRFRGGKAAPSFAFEGQEYEARPFLGVDELQRAQAHRSKLRARIAELRAEMKEQYLGDRRTMGGSELNYAPNFEEEMSDVDSWLDALDLGNNAARVNPEQILFNPDLNKESTKLDADLKGYQRQGYTDQTLRGRKPSAHVSLDRFVADTARRLGLDEGAVGLRYFGFSELTDSAQKPTFEALTAALARAGLAEDLWQHVIDEPFFTIFEGGKTTVVAVGAKWGANGLEAISQEEVRNAVAHELGHVFFRNYLADALKDAKRRNALLSHLGLKSDVTDLQVEEAVAEAVREQVIGGKPAPKSLVGRIFEGIKSALGRLVGRDSVTLESLVDHIMHRSNPSDGAAFFSGRRLLEGSARFGEGAWATMKDLYNAVVRTTHSWLRAQRGADGTPLKSFQLLADILRWTPGQSPVTRSLGGQLFDFEIAHGDYHQSYEQATTREFARYGNRVEAMLDSWAPAREKAPFWDAKKRAEIAEEQRQRQVAAVRDFVAGRDTEEARDLRRFFDELGRYFGPVLKRFDETKVLPRIFDQEALRTRKDDFLALLAERGLTEEDADRTYSILTLEQGSDYRNDAGQFFAPHFQRARMGDRLDAISDADLLPFLLIDSQPQAALWQYVHQAVKRTEFERRFGGWTYFDGNADFAPSDTLRPRLVTPADEALLRNAQPIRDDRGRVHYELERPDGKKQQVLWDQTAKYRLLRTLAAEDGASTAQLNYLLKTMEAELGRYGANFSPRIRAAQSALIAGMNWAVLPLSLTSQLTDLALPLLRSNGSFSAAWKGMKATIAEMRQAGDLTLAARANGVLAGNLRSYFASAYLDTPFLSAGAQKWNERLFKYNGMERATEFVRLFAFATGREWIKSLAAKNDAESNVQLQQLGLTRDDVAAWAAGQEKLDTGEGGLSDVDERVQQALNAFVEQSMFRPSASQRPAWASHPAAQLVWYLKSYMWSYADTVLSRTWREFQRMDGYGQKALMLALPALFMMPLAALGLALRDELRDELGSALPWRGPKREQEEAATDYAAKLVGRTGLFGPMQTLLDAGRASEYGSPYYLSLIGPFATMTDQILKRVATSGEGKTAEGVTDALLRITPVIGGLPQERKALVGWAF